MVHCSLRSAYSTYMIMAVQSLCTLPVNLTPYLPRISPAMNSDTDLNQNVSIIIIMNIPPQNMLMTYTK